MLRTQNNMKHEDANSSNVHTKFIVYYLFVFLHLFFKFFSPIFPLFSSVNFGTWASGLLRCLREFRPIFIDAVSKSYMKTAF